jgi:hypothetical protein
MSAAEAALLVLVLFALGLAVLMDVRAGRRATELRLSLTGQLAAAAAESIRVRERLERAHAALERAADDSQADELLRERLRERFVVTLTQDGETFDGLLAHVDDRTVVLVDASALGPDGSRLPVDGELLLRRDAIAYLQRP